MSLDITVVIPCHNAEKLIELTIASVLSQSGVQLELIVVDDGSEDGSREVVARLAERDARVRLQAQANTGVASARNAGVRAATAESAYVMFLDADDLLQPGALQMLRGRLEAERDLVGAFGQCSRIDAGGAFLSAAPTELVTYRADANGVSEHHNLARIGFWNVLPITPISTPGQCLFRKSALPPEPFDQACAPCEDWDLWLRLTRYGDIGVELGAVLAYRDHQSSASKNYWRMQKQRAAVYRKHIASAQPDELSRFSTAFRFGMYTFDARLCSQWARQAFSRGQWTAALRLASRSARYHLRSAAAALTGTPSALRP